MNKIIKNAFIALLFIFSASVLSSCNEPELPKLVLGSGGSNIELFYDETAKIDASVDIENNNIKYLSLDTLVATVDVSGNVRAVGLGETTIRVSVKEYPEVKLDIKVKVNPREFEITGDAEVQVGSTITLDATDEFGGKNLIWDSENNAIASVDQNGVVKGLKVGKVNIIVVSGVTNEFIMKEINILKADVENIEITRKNTGRVLILDQVKLNHKVVPPMADQTVTWSSSNYAIATVDNLGNVQTHRSGEVTITAKSVDNPNIKGTYTLVVELDPIELIRRFNLENPIHKRASSKLIPAVNELIYGSVNLYWPGDMNLRENLVAIDQTLDEANGTKTPNTYIGATATQDIIQAVELKSIRPGVKKTAIENIIFHDTGNNGTGAGAQMHHNWMIGGNRSAQYRYRSWHYTVDDKEIIRHLPDDEIAFHGDTYEAYTTTIGIETAISKGSDFYLTWHRTAKLMSSLMYDYDLGINNIKQHFDYSGKDCPQVLRATGLWTIALDMIQAELLVLQELEGYNIEFISNMPEYVNNQGRIIKLDSSPILVSYLVKITNSQGYNETTLLYSTLPAKIQ